VREGAALEVGPTAASSSLFRLLPCSVSADYQVRTAQVRELFNLIKGSMRSYILTMTILGLLSLPGLALFVGLFWSGCLGATIPILIYRGIALAILAAVLHLVISARLLKRSGLFAAEAIPPLACAAASLALSINLAFLITVPVTIDRSVTVYLLGQLAQSTDGLTEEELTSRLTEQYVGEYRAVERRMREQMASRNVRRENDRFVLSKQGIDFISFSTFVGRIFGADLKYLGKEHDRKST
jgi:hypothetical protein